MSFLKAEWRNLAIANYEFDENLLKKYLPTKTEIDKWNGVTYISLVGFMFKNTKVLGVKIPFHINFEEVNLRFYVKHKHGKEWRRGVVFIKEIVPRHAITLVANTLYKEHYQTLKMSHLWRKSINTKTIEYKWKLKNKWHSFLINSGTKELNILPGSETEFITEHFWGYTKINDQTTFEYEVTHPTWKNHEIKNYEIDVDFGQVYGDEFKILNNANPKSVMLAKGSAITVENKRKIKG